MKKLAKLSVDPVKMAGLVLIVIALIRLPIFSVERTLLIIGVVLWSCGLKIILKRW